jgi:hypothetical protein
MSNCNYFSHSGSDSFIAYGPIFGHLEGISRSERSSNMKVRNPHLICAMVVAAMAVSAAGQTSAAATGSVLDHVLNETPQSANVALADAQADSTGAPVAPTVQQLLNSADADVKFDLRDLMDILRDRRHEGWVLAAYPDPKTAQPLIGAGLSLDLPAREHLQSDPLNPHPFLEPSSADMWQAAGLDPERLQTILHQFDDRMAEWNKKGFRQRIKTLEPQVTDEEATQLFRVFALQAIYNARGYCRYFDRLTGAQQMAVSQLVYQMGFNLQEFSRFLTQINDYSVGGYADRSESGASALAENAFATDGEYWKTVQQSLIQSQWARLYRTRAVAVIAMLDPHYDDAPGTAERRVGAMLRPAVVHRRQGRSAATLQRASRTVPSGEGRPASGSRRAKLRQHKKQAV